MTQHTNKESFRRTWRNFFLQTHESNTEIVFAFSQSKKVPETKKKKNKHQQKRNFVLFVCFAGPGGGAAASLGADLVLTGGAEGGGAEAAAAAFLGAPPTIVALPGCPVFFSVGNLQIGWRQRCKS
jgi:hypothetical protein